MGGRPGPSKAPSSQFHQYCVPVSKGGLAEDRVIAKEKVPEAIEAKIPATSLKATELLLLCEKGMKLGDDEEPDVRGNPERTAKKKYLVIILW